MHAVFGRFRLEALGLLGILLGVLVVAAVLAAYLKVFTPSVGVTVRAERAGLLLSEGSDVSVRDVQVGKVARVSPDGDTGALIELRIDPDAVRRIPANVTAHLVSPTVFGPKYVDLVLPEIPARQRIAAGEVIQRSETQIEVNTVFENLVSVLTKIQPTKLNSALGAVSTTLQGRGDELGSYLSQLNTYLDRLNGSVPTLRRDLQLFGDEAGVFSDVAPDLVRLLESAPTTAGTLVDESAALDAFFVSLSGLADQGKGFLDANDEGLRASLDVLRPTTALMQRYSVEFPCLFQSLNDLRKLSEPAFGGGQPALRIFTSFGPGQRGYRSPGNLVKLGVDEPGCRPGPLEGTTPPRHQVFDDGSPTLRTRDEPTTIGNPPLAVLLFGDAAKAVGG